MCNRRRRSSHHRIEPLEPRRLLTVATWDGGGADFNWTTPGNWDGDVAPSPGDELHFAGTARTWAGNDFPVGTSFHAISASDGFRLWGNGVRLTAGVTANDISLELPIVLDADQAVVGTDRMSLHGPIDTNGQVLTIAGSADYTVWSPISGAGALVVDTPGRRGSLQRSNTHSGGTTFRAGTWSAAPGGQPAGTGPLTVAGGTFNAEGTFPGGVTASGGTLAPGERGAAQLHVSGGLALSAPVTLAMTITGPTPGTGGHDQLETTGPVSVGGATLRLASSYAVASAGQEFTLVNNTGAAPVGGQFAGLPEGATLYAEDAAYGIPNAVFRISYAGGDGNDVTLTYLRGIRTWDGDADDDNWTTPANWTWDVVPSPGDELVFPPLALDVAVNDFVHGTPFHSLTVAGGRILSSAAVRLTAGVSATDVTLDLPIVLDADQAIVGSGVVSLYDTIDTNGHVLTIGGSASFKVENVISGAGALVLDGPGASGFLTENNTHSGGTTVRGGAWSSETGAQPAGTGLLTVAGGTFEMDGPVTGGVTLTGGTLTAGGSAPVQVQVLGGLTFSAPGTLAMNLTGPAPGAGGYDQVEATGPVSLGGATLQLTNSYAAVSPGQTFTLINNTGPAPIAGQFAGLPQGSTLTANNAVFRISYAGGNGNDVALTYVRAVRTWDGGGLDNNWSTPANWAGDVAPRSGDELHFAGTVRTSTWNDLPSVAYHSITTSGDFALNGNFIFLSSGLTAGGANTRINLWLALTDDQVFSGTGITTLTSPIDTNGRDLTLRGTFHVDNVISGPGAVVVDGGRADVVYFGSNNTHTGGTTVRGGTLWTTGDQRGAGPITVTGGTLQSRALLPTVRAEGGVFTPGGDGPTTVHVWRAGTDMPPWEALWMIEPATLRIDLDGPTSGGGYDQVRVFGDLALYSPTLDLDATYAAATAGQVFTIIQNDGTDRVTGSFAGLPEGATVRSGAYLFRIGYAGGDGNDVTLTYLRAARTWDGGGADDHWTTAANWVGDVAPAPGDELSFPAAARNTATNDFPAGTSFHSLSAPVPFTFNGNGVLVANGMSIGGNQAFVDFNMPIKLAADQTFVLESGPVFSSIDTNGWRLSFRGNGPVVILNATGAGGLDFDLRHHASLQAHNTYSGGTTVRASTFSATAQQDAANPVGTGPVTLVDGLFSMDATVPGHFTLAGGLFNTNNRVFPGLAGTLDIGGGMTVSGGTLQLDVTGPLARTNYDQLMVSGGVTLTGGTLEWRGTYVPAPGESFVFIRNDSSQPVSGTFAALPEGATFSGPGGITLRISYAGGDGNDVEVTRISPGTVELSATAHAASEGGPVTFTVTRTGGFGQATVSWATGGGTATAGTDYTAASGTLVFRQGVTQQTFTVQTLTDGVAGEGDETFSVWLTAGDNALLGSASAADVTLADVDAEGEFSFSAAEFAVPESAGVAQVAIRRAGSSAGTATVTYRLFGGPLFYGSATPGEDFTDVSGSVTFQSGEVTKSFDVPILDDALAEGNEHVTINFTSVTGGATAGSPSSTRLVILDDDSPGIFSLGAFEYRAGEADGGVTVTVHRGGTLAGAVGFSYSLFSGLTTDLMVERPAGVATEGVDFLGAGGTVTLADGQASATFTVPILDDRVAEGEEIISIHLHSLTGGATFATPDHQSGRIVVTDDDFPGGAGGPFSMGPDATNRAELALFARGTDGPDNFRFAPRRGGLVAAYLNGRLQGVFVPPSRLIVQGFGGNDRISSPGLRVPLRAYGGEGDDVITGSPAGDALHGGGGNDRITGGRGRDLLIGGGGSDRLSGGAHEDLLVAGATAYDGTHEQSELAAVSIASVWTGPGDYAERTESVRLADSMLLSPDAVLDDGAADILAGQAAADCFFYGSSDRIVQRSPAETVVPG
jgi:autotransporter-associated beta strand protein